MLLILDLQAWRVSNFCRSAMIHSLVCSIHSAWQILWDEARTLLYVHYWLSICCYSPPSPTPPAGWTSFNLLQIDSDWLTSRHHRFLWSSTSRWFDDAGVCAISTINSLLSFFSTSSSSPPPPLSLAQHWATARVGNTGMMMMEWATAACREREVTNPIIIRRIKHSIFPRFLSD